MSSVKEIGAAEAQRLMGEGALVIDALPPGEYNARHIPGAINMPLQEADDATLESLDKGRPVITYCADNECDLSPRLAHLLATSGFEEVYDYVASLADWTGRGLPIEGEEAEVATAGDLARENLATCGPDEALREVVGRFGADIVLGVVDSDGVLIGRLWRGDVEKLVRDERGDDRAMDVMHRGPSTFRPDVPIAEMAEWFERRKVDAFIITSLDGRPLGALYREDVERVVREAHARHLEHTKA